MRTRSLPLASASRAMVRATSGINSPGLSEYVVPRRRYKSSMEWLNYHHLLYFWTVAREGGLAPAGKALRLSQSAISGQIRTLEDNLGHSLFERRGRKLEMTETGRVVFRYAEQIFGLGREMLDVVRERPVNLPMRLVVGISDVIPKHLVRNLLVSVSALVDGVVGALVDGSRSRSGARLGLTGMGIGYQRVIA